MQQTILPGWEEGRFFEQLVAAGPPCALIRSDNYEILFVNRRFETELGYELAALQEHKVSLPAIVAEQERERVLSELHYLCAAVHKEQLIFSLQQAKGEERSYMVSISPVADAAGKSAYYYLVFNLETHMARLPYISYESRNLTLQKINDIGYGSFEWLIADDAYFLSDSMYSIFEVAKEAAPANLLSAYVHSEDTALLTGFIQDVLSSDKDCSVELRIITPAGKPKILGCLGHRVKDRSGQVCKMVVSVKDVTIPRGVEADLKKNVDDLYHSNKELEQFAYIASHDLQEPLRKVSAFGSMLSDKYGPLLEAEGRNYLDRMIRATENMKIMINHLLEFSRITQGVGQYVPVSLDFVLLEVRSDLSLLIEETGTQLAYSNLPVVQGDLVQLKQLMANLVNNAIKFRRPDINPHISITAATAGQELLIRLGLDASQPHHLITIRDNGIGFEQEYAARIFKIFQRLHGKSAYPGSGIGLAICQRIAENHRGAIFADSNPGSGAVFSLVLPAAQA